MPLHAASWSRPQLVLVCITPLSQAQVSPATAPVPAIVPVVSAPTPATQPATESAAADTGPTNLQKVVVSALWIWPGR